MGITIEEMASRLGISKVSLYYRETGSKEWTMPELIKLCQMVNGEVTVSSGGNDYIVSIRSTHLE